MTQPCDIGLIGLAVMGENLALNIESRGFRIAVFNRTTSVVDELWQAAPKARTSSAAIRLEELVASLAAPRKVMMMVKAGPAVDALIDQLHPAALARRRDHRRRQHATIPTPSGARNRSNRRGCCTSAAASPAAKRGPASGRA